MLATDFFLSCAQDVKAALEKNPGTKIVFLVHGESSTGTLQPLAGLGKLCHEQGEEPMKNEVRRKQSNKRHSSVPAISGYLDVLNRRSPRL